MSTKLLRVLFSPRIARWPGGGFVAAVTARMLVKARRMSGSAETLVVQHFAEVPVLAKDAFWIFNAERSDASANFAPEMIEQAARLGLLRWPRRIRSAVRGKRVLDMGCRGGADAVGFIVVGACSYTGVANAPVSARSDMGGPKTGGTVGFPWSDAEISAAMPRIRLLEKFPSNSSTAERFDRVILRGPFANSETATEALGLGLSVLAEGGELVIHYRNPLGLTKGGAPIGNRSNAPGLAVSDLRKLLASTVGIKEWKTKTRLGLRATPSAPQDPDLAPADLEVSEVLCRAAPGALGADVDMSAAPKGFTDNPDKAVEAYWIFNATRPDAWRSYSDPLIRKAVAFNYLSWPKKIHGHIAGKDVADIGCGTGIHGIGFVTVGVQSYTGVDPRIDIDSDQARNLRRREWESFGMTGREIMKVMPRIRLFSGSVQDLPQAETFDVVLLHNVTEHLQDLDEVFESIVPRLRNDGVLIYNHHNFYCWNGHHLKPKTIDQIDASDPGQRDLLDWAHVTFEPPEGHYIATGLNRIRMHELRDVTARYFDIIEWSPFESKVSQGRERFSPTIQSRYSHLRPEEFTTQGVFCRAAPKGQGTRYLVSFKSRHRDLARNAEFQDFYARCCDYSMTTMERLFSVYQAVEYVVREKIPGDFVECGVWRGGSSMMAAFALRYFGDDGSRHLWLYDTFAGMSEPSAADHKFGQSGARQRWEQSSNAAGSTWNLATLDEVRLNMETTCFPLHRMKFVKGKVEETLRAVVPERIALLRLDTDFYESTLAELKVLYPRLVAGGVLIIDDYGTWAGARKAVDEYFREHSRRPLLSRLDVGGRIGVKPMAPSDIEVG